MKNNTRIIIGIIVIILLLLIGGFIYVNNIKADLKKARLEIRKEVLKGDSLIKINETQYRKLVADTLTEKELRERIRQLGIELDAKPKIVYETKIVVKEVIKDTDSISMDSTGIVINSYYPQKEGYFVNYMNKISLQDTTGVEKWSFNPVDVSIALSQRKDGIWQSDIKLPPFMEVGEVTVQATPLEFPEPKNFGVIGGAGAGYDFRTGEVYGRVSGDLRFKRFYVGVGAATNQTVDGNLKFEF